jgi:hypothetical protein
MHYEARACRWSLAESSQDLLRRGVDTDVVSDGFLDGVVARRSAPAATFIALTCLATVCCTAVPHIIQVMSCSSATRIVLWFKYAMVECRVYRRISDASQKSRARWNDVRHLSIRSEMSTTTTENGIIQVMFDIVQGDLISASGGILGQGSACISLTRIV